MSRVFYEDRDTKTIYMNYRDISRAYGISIAWVHEQMKHKKLPLKKLTEKEVARRATLYTRKMAS